jgi:hypothetical protein
MKSTLKTRNSNQQTNNILNLRRNYLWNLSCYMQSACVKHIVEGLNEGQFRGRGKAACPACPFLSTLRQSPSLFHVLFIYKSGESPFALWPERSQSFNRCDAVVMRAAELYETSCLESDHGFWGGVQFRVWRNTSAAVKLLSAGNTKSKKRLQWRYG